MLKWRTWLNDRVDNCQLILFRMLFGMLMFFEGIGAIATGWVKETFVDPQFTFNFMGFEFLQFLVGPQMYVVYIIMGVLGIFISLGWQYRFSIILFTILWSATYFLQKSHYNNHYYLVMLISMVMCFLPANRFRALDARFRIVKKRITAPRWAVLILPAMVAIVYFYAAIAKIYPDWLAAKPISLWFTYKQYTAPFWSAETAAKIKSFFSNNTVHYLFSYAGILFDLLIIPAFLWKRTRTIALIASLCFHLMNSAIFQIGVFPYFALAFVIFFYPRKVIRRIFFRDKPRIVREHIRTALHPVWFAVLAAFFAFQIFLPLRHHLIKDDVLWTEEGHRLSWRMMLRSKSAMASFKVKHTESGFEELINLNDYVTPNQRGDLLKKPDMMYQFGQHLEKTYNKKIGLDIEVYVDSKVGVNGRQLVQFTNPDFDITSVKWKRFGHQEWILPKPF